MKAIHDPHSSFPKWEKATVTTQCLFLVTHPDEICSWLAMADRLQVRMVAL